MVVVPLEPGAAVTSAVRGLMLADCEISNR